MLPSPARRRSQTQAQRTTSSAFTARSSSNENRLVLDYLPNPLCPSRCLQLRCGFCGRSPSDGIAGRVDESDSGQNTSGPTEAGLPARTAGGVVQNKKEFAV